MFGSLSCDHCYFQLSPRKSGVGVEKERETYQSHRPGGHTGPGQQELSSQPGCAEDFSLRGSEPHVCIATSAVTRRSGLTRCSRFTSLSERCRGMSHQLPSVYKAAGSCRSGRDRQEGKLGQEGHAGHGRQEGPPQGGSQVLSSGPHHRSALCRQGTGELGSCMWCLQPWPREKAGRVPCRTSRNKASWALAADRLQEKQICVPYTHGARVIFTFTLFI